MEEDLPGVLGNVRVESRRGAPREIAAIALILVLPGFVHYLGTADVLVVVLGLFLASLAGVAVLWRWDISIPYEVPWYRLAVVTVFLLAMIVVMPRGSTATPDAEWGRVANGILLVLIMPGMIGSELFYRGAVYSVLEKRWGAGVAVLGSAISWTLSVGAPVLDRDILSTLIIGLFLGLSRSTTGSIAPALLSQSILAATSVLFLVFVLF